MSPDLSPLALSLLVSCAALALVVPPGLYAAWRLSRGRPSVWKSCVETLLTLPLVLPPTVVGYVLLLTLGRGTAFGRWLNDSAGVRLVFTWQGAALAASVMAFPLFVRTASAAFAAADAELLEAGRTLGAGEGALFRFVLLPLSYRGLLAATALAFARALGEFGATLMVAGSIAGRTQTLPLALYGAVQNGDDRAALNHALLLTLLAFALLAGVNAVQGRVAAARNEA